MRILKEGDRGWALAPERGRVRVEYAYQTLELDSGTKVADVLVGIDPDSGEVLSIPAQSTPRIRQAREHAKDGTLTVRITRELDDILQVLADHYEVSPSKFSPALIRYYLDEATDNPRLVRRLQRLAASPLATSKLLKKLTVKAHQSLIERIEGLAESDETLDKSDLVRGAVLAAKEDVLEGQAKRREERLQAVAVAV